MNIGFDIGGTNTRVAEIAVNGVQNIFRIETPEDPVAGAEQLIALIRQSAGDNPVNLIVGGCPGTIKDDDVILRNPNRSRWAGYALGSALKRAFIGASVTIRNDADMAGLGEAHYGAGKEYDIVAYMGIGTGVGTTRIVSGTIDRARFGFEAGHQIIDIQAGKTLEGLIGGRYVALRTGLHPKDVPRNEYERMTPILAVGIYNAILHWSPDVFVLGGSMMNEESGFRLSEVVKAVHALPTHSPEWPAILSSTLGNTAGLHGARAMLH
ncbi:ROK family protein [Candidatus Kaiserbacteria bacterium]|nr:ROK family protein [Candidatus Kaiserbacteria bacterium]